LLAAFVLQSNESKEKDSDSNNCADVFFERASDEQASKSDAERFESA
jgi:hypothetical protein